ncbi:type IV secretory system conjugative DNA transfer family protein [Vibrio cholerae]|uniref:type IV secretory system conjugative DNA transfer family protein n=1 Tax=Vibrio cholerae TaxID=666 RepID=UPI0005B431AB|nr:type IV secretory system conjugative DNA transfer family protein [Vibrio cholerae]
MALSKKKKANIALVFFVFVIICFIGGQLAGGALFFDLTSIPLSYLRLDSLYQNFQAYHADKALKPYLFLSVGLALIISIIPFIMAVALITAMQKKEEIHGSARFATDSELAKSGFFPKKGQERKPTIILGKMKSGRFKGKLIELAGQLFAYVSAPTRSGKGVGIVIPNLLTWWHSVVVVDIKYENFIKSAGYRKKFGQEVYLFSPDGFFEKESDREFEKIRTHRWNCYDYVRRSEAFRAGDVLMIARSLYPNGDKSKSEIWNNLAAKLFVGLSLWMMDSERITGIKPSLPYLYRLINVEGGLIKWMKQEIQQEYTSYEVKAEFNSCIAMATETFSSVLSNLAAPLDILSDKVVAAALAESDFDFRELRKKKISLYIGCAPNRLPVFEKLFNLFFEQLISENTQTLPEHDESLKYQCLLLLDEFTSLGRIRQIEKAISYAAGYGLRFLLIFQDHDQMDEVYGDKNGKNIRKNHAVNVLYPPKEVDQYVKNISDTLGTKTVRKKKISRTVSAGKPSRTTNIEELKRPLLMPSEIVALGHEKHPKADKLGINTLMIAENQQAFIAEKAFYFDDPEMLERAKYSESNVPTIPLLEMN